MGGGKGSKQKRLPASPADEDDFLGSATSKPKPGTSVKANLPVGSRGDVSAALASRSKTDKPLLDEDGMVKPRTYIRLPNGTLQAHSNHANSGDTVSTVTKDTGGADNTWQQVVATGLGEAGRTHQIKKFVKESLFSHLKFFVQEEELIWSVGPGSISQFVVNGLHVSDDMEKSRIWWHNNHGTVLRELNRKRSDVVAGIKKAFLCKYLC